MRHLTLQQLSATVDQALSGVSLELVRRHLEECEECRARGSKLARVDGVVAQLVSHDPGDAWLEAVVVEIDERVCAEVAGRFDPPAHPAGPPPLEFAAAPAPLTADQLDAIWEEGSTTPRPSSVKPREAAAENAAARGAAPAPQQSAPVPPVIPPVASPAPPSPRPVEKPAPIAKAAPVEKPAPVAKAPPVAKAAPAEKPAPVAKATPVETSAPVAKTPPAEKSATPAVKVPPLPKPQAKAVPAPPARTRVPSYARDEAEEQPPMRWGRHADRIVRARRDASNVPRETLVPIAFGLVGGALAGALVVTFFFLRHGSPGGVPAAPAAHVARVAEPAAAVEDPVSHPQIEPVQAATTPSRETPAVTPVAPPPPATVPAPAKPRATTPAPTSSPARTTHTRTDPAAAARAIPTGEESWPLLCGEVVDESGAPVTGARILLADLDVGARTDRRGRFCLAAPPGDRTLSVVALGFATQRRAVSVANGAADVHVVLKAAP